MKIGYARVSSKDQTAEQQVQALKKAGCDRVFVETASGAKRDRPELAKMMALAHKGDTVVIWKLDRLARSTAHLIELAESMKANGVELVSITDSFDTSTASGRLFFTVLGAIAQFEREVIIERVQAGVDRARREGRVGGRPKTDQARLDHAFAELGRGSTVSAAAKKAGISRRTFYRAMSAAKTSQQENVAA